MHELSLAEGIVQLVEVTARRERAQRVRRVVLEIGDLAAVESDTLRFCFEVVTRGGVAQGAELSIESVPGAGWCSSCAQTVAVHALYDACPLCGDYQLELKAGTEMRVKAIEIDG